MKSIIGIDLGIKIGLAHFLDNGKLLWYWSHNFGSRTKLRKGIYTILHKLSRKSPIKCLVIEGSKILGRPWFHCASKLNVPCYYVEPYVWREKFFGKKEMKSQDAKKTAIAYAKNIIISSGLSPPKSLNHNAAEAILIGLWGVLNFTENKEVLGEELFY